MMAEDNTKSGKRYEIVVMRINRNNEGALKQLYALEDYFKKHGDNYSIMHAAYGSPAKALKKLIAWYLDSESLAHPRKTLFEINKMFIERKIVDSGDVSDMGLQADIQTLYNTVAKFFGAKPEKPEDEE
jgi:hypothetical protein